MMTPGQRLTPDTEIREHGAALRYQGDGNLVLYGPPGPLWASGRFDAPGYVEMQHDGNLCAYNAAGVPYWASDTFAPGAVLHIARTGLKIVDPAGVVVWEVETGWIEPVPVPGTHPDPIVGQLRVEGGAYCDATGPRLPVIFHAGDLIGQGLILGLAHVEPVFDQLAAWGYHGMRSWFQLHLTSPRWIPGPTEQGWNPLDNPVLFQEILAAAAARGLKWNLAGGGIKGLPNSTEDQLFDLVAAAMDAIGPEHFLMVSALNEAQDTGDEDDQDPAELERLINRVRSRHPGALYSLTAYTGVEDPHVTAKYTLPWMPFSIVNGSRAGHFWDKIRHVFSWTYEGNAQRRNSWQDEPFGIEPGVSVQENGHELTATVMQLAAAMAATSRQVWTYMSGTGVVFRGFDNLPGLVETPAILRALPQDLMRYETIGHSGASKRGTRIHAVRGDSPNVRADYAIANDGRFVEITYGPPTQSHDLPTERVYWDERTIVSGPEGRVITGRLT